MAVILTKYVTVSAKIDMELRKKLKDLGIKPSEVIKRLLKRMLRKEPERFSTRRMKKQAE